MVIPELNDQQIIVYCESTPRHKKPFHRQDREKATPILATRVNLS